MKIFKPKTSFGYDPIKNSNTNLDFEILLHPLNYDERIAITLFYMEDYSIKEIAKILKTSENNIKSRIHRGKQKIKINYERKI